MKKHKKLIPFYDAPPILLDGTGRKATAIRLADGRWIYADDCEERSLQYWAAHGATAVPGDGTTMEILLASGYFKP
jgi:hypothetical protein